MSLPPTPFPPQKKQKQMQDVANVMQVKTNLQINIDNWKSR